MSINKYLIFTSIMILQQALNQHLDFGLAVVAQLAHALTPDNQLKAPCRTVNTKVTAPCSP